MKHNENGDKKKYSQLYGGLWGCKNPNKKVAFFRDIPTVRRCAQNWGGEQQKRKRQETQEDNKLSKRPRRSPAPEQAPETTNKDRGEKKGEENRQKSTRRSHGKEEAREEKITRSIRKRPQAAEINDFLRIQRLEARRRERSGQGNGQGNDEVENETVKEVPQQNQVREGYVIPKISPFKALNEGNGEKQEEEPDRAISPLYMDSRPDLYGEQNEAQDADQESSEEIEVDLSGRPVVKTEYGCEYKIEEEIENLPEVKEEPESEEGYEEEAETEEDPEEPEETPPRTVIFREVDNKREDKEKSERAKIEEDQRTKPVKERLGKRHSVFDRLQTPPRETNPHQTTSVSPQTTSAIMRENRWNVRKSRTERDRQSTRRERQRADSNSKSFLANLCGKERKESSESEEEDKDKKTSKTSKPKK